MKNKRVLKRKILATVLGVSIGLLLVFNSTADTYAEPQVKTETLNLGDVKHTHVGSASSSPNGCFQNHTRPWAWYSGHGSQHYSHTTCDCGMTESTVTGQDYGNCNGAKNSGWVNATYYTHSMKTYCTACGHYTDEPLTAQCYGHGGHVGTISVKCTRCGRGAGTNCDVKVAGHYTSHSHTSSCIKYYYHSHTSSCYTDHYTSCGVDNGSCGYRYDWYTVNCGRSDATIFKVYVTKTKGNGNYTLNAYVDNVVDYVSDISFSWYDNQTSAWVSNPYNVTGYNPTKKLKITYKDSGAVRTVELNADTDDYPHATITVPSSSWVQRGYFNISTTTATYFMWENLTDGTKSEWLTDANPEIFTNGDYKVTVKDIYGNVQSYTKADYSCLSVSNIDKTAPVATIESNPETSTTQYSQNVVLHAVATDSQSGVGTYQWQKNGVNISGANKAWYTIASTSDGDDYTVVVGDTVGNTVTSEAVKAYCDTDAPSLDIETESNSHGVTLRVKTEDILLKGLQIISKTRNATVIEEENINKKTFTKDYHLTEEDEFTVVAIDSADNKISKVVSVASVSNVYGLDEVANLYHTHSATNTAPCYTSKTTTTGYIGHTCVHAPSSPAWHCPNCGTYVQGWTEGSTAPVHWCTESKTTTSFTCTHGNEKIGSMVLNKTTEGEYVLTVNSSLSHATVTSYSWTGVENGANEEFPSVRPNGNKATDINGTKVASIVVPDFGTYTCTVVYKDSYSNVSKTLIFQYKVNDFDLEPPSVELIENTLYSESLDYENKDEDNGEIDAFLEKKNTGEPPFATAYKEKTTLTLHLADNMSLSKIKCVSSNMTFEKALSRKKTEDVDITFEDNGLYKFELYDAILNCYTFTVKIVYLDQDNPVITTSQSTPAYSKKSASYTLQVASTDFSKMYYKWLRKDHDTGEISVYKDWNDKPFVEINDNGAYAVMVADSVYYNASETEPAPTESYLARAGHKHVSISNLDFKDPKLNYYYCDTTPPVVEYELRATPKFVMVTIKATDNQDTVTELKYTCDKPIKQDGNIFYATQNGTYKFTVTDESGNSTTIEVYIDVDEMTGGSPSIIKDLKITPMGTNVTYEGRTYSNSGFNYQIIFKDFVDTNFTLTKWTDKGQYKNITSYSATENGSYVLYSRYTRDETVNTGEIEYQTKIVTDGVDKEAPTVAISVKNKVAYITATDKGSGVGKIEVEKRTSSSKTTSFVDYSEKREESVAYALPMEYNTIYGIKVYDNLKNEGIQYYVSTDGVLKGDISNLFIVIFVDGSGKQISEQYLIKGANAVAPDAPTKEGCTFTKWSCDYTNVSKNLLVYPVFTSNVTGQILDEEIHYDESLRRKLKDSGFMFSTGGDGELDESKAERREVSDTQFVQQRADDSTIIVSLYDENTPRTYYKKYVAKYSGTALIGLLVLLLAFKEWQERKRIR